MEENRTNCEIDNTLNNNEEVFYMCDYTVEETRNLLEDLRTKL